MAISTYSELKTAVADWLNRDDLTSVIPTFIDLTEAKLKRRYKDYTPLSDSNTSNWILTGYPDVYLYGALLEASPYLIDDERVNIWAQLYSAAIATLRGSFEESDLSDYSGLRVAISDWLGRADLDQIIPQLIKLAEAKLFRRFSGVDPLSNASPLNWILENHPDLYLYGALIEAEPYLKNDDRIATWRTLFDAELARTRKPNFSADFDDYAGLKLSIADWLQRYDLDDAIDDFIDLAEARIRRRVRDITPLDVFNTTNWVLTNHPDVYLFGSLVEAAPYIGDDERVPLWQSKYAAAFAEVRRPNTSTALDTYDGLKFAIADWLDRPDIDEIIPEFIQLAEARIKRRVRDIDSLSDSNTTNWVLTNHPDVYLFGALSESAPYLGQDERAVLWQAKYDAAFAEVRRPDADSNLSNYDGLKFAVSDWLNRPDLDETVPEFIRLAEARLQRRFKDVTTLTASNTTNWMLTNHPDVYLHGALSEAAPYLGDDQRVPVWQSKYESALLEVRRPNTGTSFDTYAGLQLAIADWLDRPDLDDIIPQFIEMAEAQMSRDIRHFEMENRATSELDGQYIQRPTDWVETIRLHITSGGTKNLQLLSAASMADKRQGAEDATGEPAYYRHAEDGFEVYPAPDGVYEVELLYYQKIPSLSSSNANNWLLLSHPDVYLYGSLLHAAPYIKDDERATTWAQLYSSALARVNESGNSASYSGTGLTLKVRGLG